MYHYVNAITNTKGDALIGFFVKAVDAVTGSTASLYADANSTPIVSVSGIANAAEVDSDGNASFYIAGGEYHIDIYATDGVTFLRRISNVPMVDFTVAAGNVASRAILSAKNASAGDVWTLTEEGRTGLFKFDASDLSDEVTADTQQGIYIAPDSDDTGASGAWVRQYSGPADFRWFGAVANTTALTAGAFNGTTNTAILNAARAALTAAGKGWLHIPQQAAAYRFATAPSQIHDGIKITGDGWHENPGQVGVTTYVGIQTFPGTVLCFDADIPGLKFIDYTDNNANATAFEYQGARFSVLEDIMLYGGGGTSATAHGLENRTVLDGRNVRIENFAGDGLRNLAWAQGANPYGYTIGSKFRVLVKGCGMHGIHNIGDNANVMHFDACVTQLNAGCGVLDEGLLGNKYTGHTSATNNTTVGVASARRTIIEAEAPGLTDSTVGSYYTTSAVGAHVFDACYTEVGAGVKAHLVTPTTVIGGNLASVSGVRTAASTCHVYGLGFLENIGSITPSSALLVVNGDLKIVRTSSSIPTFTLTPDSAAFSNIIMKGSGGSTALGLDILAGSGAAYMSTDSLVIRNAAQAVTFGTFDASGLNITATTPQLKISGTKVVGVRDTGWTADTGTAKKTATAAYVVGTGLTVGVAYDQAEVTAIITRQALVEAALRDATQEIKALKDALLAHGLIGA